MPQAQSQSSAPSPSSQRLQNRATPFSGGLAEQRQERDTQGKLRLKKRTREISLYNHFS